MTNLIGSITISKRLRTHPVWQRADYGWAWLDLLMLANDTSRVVFMNGERVSLERGQLCWSLRSLEKEWQKSGEWLTRFLYFCRDHDMLRLDTNSRYTVITILNYSAYNPVTVSEPGSETVTKTVSEPGTQPDTKAGSETEQNKEQRNLEVEGGSATPKRIVTFEQALALFKADSEQLYSKRQIRQEWLYYDSRRGPNGEWLTERGQVIADWRSALERALLRSLNGRENLEKNAGQSAAQKIFKLDKHIRELIEQIDAFEDTQPELSETLRCELEAAQAERLAL